MIILNTNVVAELMRPSPNPSVLSWGTNFPIGDLFSTVITEAEILFGLSLLADGSRRKALEAAAARLFGEVMRERILPFDRPAARAYAEITASRRSAGRPIAMADAMIAAIARLHGAKLATRNMADFDGCGLDLIDPWA